jgi:hypothetical protein
MRREAHDPQRPKDFQQCRRIAARTAASTEQYKCDIAMHREAQARRNIEEGGLANECSSLVWWFSWVKFYSQDTK